jgi:hypothetical protein
VPAFRHPSVVAIAPEYRAKEALTNDRLAFPPYEGSNLRSAKGEIVYAAYSAPLI